MTASLVRIAVLCVVAMLASAASPARGETGSTQTTFASPEAGFAAFVDAARKGDKAALLAILGPEAKPILESGDPVADQAGLERFVASYDAAHSIQLPNARRAELITGKDKWPMPIPLVKEDAGWRFDTDEGDEEIIARRIGRNERFAIQASLAFVDAQREYWEQNPDSAEPLHYARRILSSEGKRDGLYYPTGEGEDQSPLGEGFAKAKAEGYEFGEKAGGPQPFHGYLFRILEAQGPHARDGAYDYVVGDFMIGGFALLAVPATWDNSGVMSFLVNQDGVVYEKDLGPDTSKLAAKIRSFDPGEGWTRVAEEDAAPDED